MERGETQGKEGRLHDERGLKGVEGNRREYEQESENNIGEEESVEDEFLVTAL